MSGRLHVELLSPSEIDSIYEKCLTILSTYGVKVDYEKGLKFLDQAGAQVDFKTQMVKFPVDMIEAALKTVPHEITIKGGLDKHDYVVPHPEGSFYTTTCVQTMLYHNPDNNEFEDVTQDSFAKWCQLTDHLPQIDICAIQTPMDVPRETADIHGLNIQLQNTSKPLMLLAYCFESVPYLFDLMLARQGGEAGLKERGLLMVNPTSLSPLVYKDMDMEELFLATKYGIPVAANSLVVTGGTGPVTTAGTVLLTSTEILAMLVMSQLMNPGNPFVSTVFNTSLDMMTGSALLGDINTNLTRAACAQFIKAKFKTPVETFSYMSDSYSCDGQASVEKSLMPTLDALGGSDILYGAGRLGGTTCASPVQLVIDNYLTEISRQFVAGVKFDEDRLALDQILEAGAGGNYLTMEHTRDYCRDGIHPELFNQIGLDTWKATGKKNLYDRAVDKYKEIQKEMKPQDLPDDVVKEMNSIVKKADKAMCS